VAQPCETQRAKRGARRSPQGEDGLVMRADVVRLHHRSINFPEQEYVGATEDLKRRLPEHNAGKSAHTAKFKPWELIWYCAFRDKHKALAFEKYLKSHSGRAFAKKRFS
jgi:putative endonuclease